MSRKLPTNFHPNAAVRFDVVFGFDCVSNDYKVLKIAYQKPANNNSNKAVDVLSVYMYSSNSDSWREIQVGIALPSLLCYPVVPVLTSGPVVDGVLYLEAVNTIVTFSLHSEMFGLIPYPSFDHTRKSNDMDFEGSVAVVLESVRDGSLDEKEVSLWTMEAVSDEGITSKMDGGKMKRVGGSKSLSQLMDDQDADYQRLSKIIEAMNKRMDKFEFKFGGKEDVKENYTSLREQVEYLSVRVDDMEVGDDFNETQRLFEHVNADKKKMFQLIEEANNDKKKLIQLIEEANDDKKKMFQLIEEMNDEKKRMFQLIEDVNACVEKLEIKFENETRRSEGLILDSPTSSGQEVDSDIRIYVGKLPRSVTERDLYDYFEHFGRITNVKVVLDKVTRCSRGVGFVTFNF